MFKRKNKNKPSVIDRRGTVLIDEVYDGFKELVNDGRDQSRYTNFRVSNVLMKVEKDEYALVVNRINPSEVEVVDKPGLYPISRLSKYIYVPNPITPMIVDFKPTNEEDKKMNFTFTPNIKSTNADGQDEIFIDYRIHLRWRSADAVKQYYYSVNPMQNIQATIVSLLREFVANKSKDELMSGFSMYGLDRGPNDEDDRNNIDPHKKLKKIAEQYGLEVVDFDVNNIKLSNAVQEAKNKASVSIEEANARKKTAVIDRETAQINAEANMAGFREGVKFAGDMGFSPSDSRTLFLLHLLNEREIAKTAKAYIAGGNSRMNLESWAAFNGFKGIEGKDGNVIDADYTEEPEVGRGRKR